MYSMWSVNKLCNANEQEEILMKVVGEGSKKYFVCNKSGNKA